MNPIIKIDISRRTVAQLTLIRAWLRCGDTGAVGARYEVMPDHVRKTLTYVGLSASVRKALLAGTPYQVVRTDAVQGLLEEDVAVFRPRPINSGDVHRDRIATQAFAAADTGAGAVEPLEALEALEPAYPMLEPLPLPEPVRLDVVERHKFEATINAMRSAERDLTKRLAAAEDHRASILGLSIVPAVPMPYVQGEHHQPHAQAVLLHVSDTHVGETIDLEEVAGVNRYDRQIARLRMGRLFGKSALLTTTAWPASDDAPSEFVVMLGGDLISGHGLHPEHAETDYGTAYEQVKDAASWIAAGILRLHLEMLEHFKAVVPIRVISVVGNHGRMTFGKPRTKLVSLQSFDTLVADFVEAGLRAYPSITHTQPKGFDAYFSAVGWPCLLTHGDRMGSGGGLGFIGPMAAIIKGHRKIVDTEHRQRRPVRWVFSGHFHTSGLTPFGFANGASCGYGEFAKSIRADPEQAQQNYVVVGERLGLIRYQPIVVGTPDEGTIYDPKAGIILPLAA